MDRERAIVLGVVIWGSLLYLVWDDSQRGMEEEREGDPEGQQSKRINFSLEADNYKARGMIIAGKGSS